MHNSIYSYKFQLYYVANSVNSLDRTNVAKTTFLEYFSVKIFATLSDTIWLPHTNASCPQVSLDPYVRMEKMGVVGWVYQIG